MNTYAKLSLSILSDKVESRLATSSFSLSVSFLKETRTTRTVARSFVPEFNHSIDFPVPLIWNDNRSQTISLAEMLEHGELKIDIYHQMSSTNEANHQNDKRPLDVYLCYCTIPLKDLISRHTGKCKNRSMTL